MTTSRAAAGDGGVVTQASLKESVELRRRARVAKAEADAQHAALVADILAGCAIELGRYRPVTQLYERTIIFAIYDVEDEDRAGQSKPVVIERFKPTDES